jgi:hypothetical protein
VFVPSSQVRAFTGATKLDLPGVFITGSGVGAGSPPPQDKRNTNAKKANT